MDRNQKYDAFDIPVACIYYDSSFNCRGEFTPQSVHELSQSIAQRGLDFPLVVQPADDVEGGLPDYKQYRLLCGHRRFKAVTQFLDWTRVPCIMRGHLTDREARLLNLTENLERNDLNPLEEARAVGHLFPQGTVLAEIARELKRSTSWVKYRLDILKLPEHLQNSVAAGTLKVNDIRFIVSLPPEQQEEAAHTVMRDGRKKLDSGKRRPSRRFKRQSQINSMVERLFEAGLNGLTTRVLAWVTGRVTDDEIISEIQAASGMKTAQNGIVPTE